jgi:hypothetical protein
MTEEEEAAVWGDPTPAEIEQLKRELREAHIAQRRNESVKATLHRVIRRSKPRPPTNMPARLVAMNGKMQACDGSSR